MRSLFEALLGRVRRERAETSYPPGHVPPRPMPAPAAHVPGRGSPPLPIGAAPSQHSVLDGMYLGAMHIGADEVELLLKDGRRLRITRADAPLLRAAIEHFEGSEVDSWIERGLTARDIAAEVAAGRPLSPRTPASYVRATWYCTLPHDTEAGEIGFAVKPLNAELPHRYALPTEHAEHLLQSLALSLGFTLLKIAEPSPTPFVPVRPRQPDGEP